MFTDADIPRRTPVWNALSELWRDTELRPEDYDRIAETLARSGYSLQQLREIYRFEVAPVLFPNLMSVAGEWAGFDAEWLHRSIIRFQRGKRPFLRFLVVTGVGRWIVTWATEAHWKKLVDRVEQNLPTTPTTTSRSGSKKRLK